MRTADFNFLLPDHLIAQQPPARRDESRLFVLDRATGEMRHHPCFRAFLSYLRPGDLLVLNDTRVIPARLRGAKASTGGLIEILLLQEVVANDWWALLRPGKRVRPGTVLTFSRPGSDTAASATVKEKRPDGHCRLHFSGAANIRELLPELGEIPLPPYITRRAAQDDRERYQTVYAQESGSVAAPTAGLHFTEALLEEVKQLGVQIEFVTLHIGAGTFAPVKSDQVEHHVMHEERFTLTAGAAERINAGRRVIAVGTTTVRVLESVAAAHDGRLAGCEGATRIFIYPPYRFQVVDGLLTNFHLPQSTLLMLVSAFAAPGETRGRDWVLQAYAEAVRQEYRFFSYGDAMLII